VADRALVDAAHRHNTLADRIADVLDQAGMAVTVHAGDGATHYSLAELARVLDGAGLIDDSRIGEPA
jgi:predicted phosphodiesterase